MGNAHPSIAPYETFTALNGTFVIAVGNDGQFAKLAETLGVARLSADPRVASNERRVADRVQLRDILDDILATELVAHWVALMTAAGVPARPVNDTGEAIAFAGDLGLGAVTEIAGPDRSSTQISNPITLSRTPARYRLVPPEIGGHQGAHWLATEGK